MLGLIVGYLPPYIFTQVYLFCAELFPTSERALGVGLGWNIGVGIFGGFGGVLAEASLTHLGPSGPGWLISFGGLISAGAVLWGRSLQSRGLLQVTHLRASPYWGIAPVAAA